jgi:hypothetical protein
LLSEPIFVETGKDSAHFMLVKQMEIDGQVLFDFLMVEPAHLVFNGMILLASLTSEHFAPLNCLALQSPLQRENELADGVRQDVPLLIMPHPRSLRLTAHGFKTRCIFLSHQPIQ